MQQFKKLIIQQSLRNVLGQQAPRMNFMNQNFAAISLNKQVLMSQQWNYTQKFQKISFKFCQNHNDGNQTQIDLSKVSENLEKTIFTLKSGQQVTQEMTDKKSSVSYTLGDEIKGTRGNQQEGLYVLMYTCKVCETKQQRSFTKNAYHNGVVIIRCEGCEKQHLISDNLGWFTDDKTNVFDYTNEKKKVISAEEQQEINNILNMYMQNSDYKEKLPQSDENKEQEKN